MATAGKDNSDFPWHLGVFDAHCHPTDTMSSVADIASMNAKSLTIMATRGQDQKLVADVAKDEGIADSGVKTGNPEGVVPSFGWHPWFSHQIYDDGDQHESLEPESGEEPLLSENDKVQHYIAVLDPTPTDRHFLTSLPEPRSLSTLIRDTSQHFVKYSHALMGEVGLDKAFRIPEAWLPSQDDDRDDTLTPGGREGRRLSPYRVNLNHQKKILLAQLRLAGRMQRPASVHGVQAHGHLYETLRTLWLGHEREVESKRERRRKASKHTHAREESNNAEEEVDAAPNTTPRGTDTGMHSFPPRICLHSYSGPPETLKQYLHPSVPVRFFFSFSTVINFSTSASGKTEQCIRALPDDCILIESDLHIAGERMDQNLKEVALKICELKGWGVEQGVRQLGRNWKVFVFGEEYAQTHDQQNAATS